MPEYQSPPERSDHIFFRRDVLKNYFNMPGAKWGRPLRREDGIEAPGTISTTLPSSVSPSRRSQSPWPMVMAAMAGLLVAAAEAILGYTTASLDDSEWASALVVVPVAVVALTLGLSILILWLWEPRGATMFALTLVVFSLLAVWWISMYGLAFRMELDAGATGQARSLLATTTGTKCVWVSTGAVGPLSAPYTRCVYVRTDLRQVTYVGFQSTSGLIYEPGVSTPNAPSLCVRHLSGGWWASTRGSWAYWQRGPVCPSGYQGILGG